MNFDARRLGLLVLITMAVIAVSGWGIHEWMSPSRTRGSQEVAGSTSKPGDAGDTVQDAFPTRLEASVPVVGAPSISTPSAPAVAVVETTPQPTPAILPASAPPVDTASTDVTQGASNSFDAQDVQSSADALNVPSTEAKQAASSKVPAQGCFIMFRQIQVPIQ